MKSIKYWLLAVMIIILAAMFVSCDKESNDDGHVITFATNGGEEIQEQKGKTIVEFPQTTKEGYYLEGWYIQEDFSGSQVSFPYELGGDTKLYARWFSAEEGSPYLDYTLDNQRDEYAISGYSGKSRIVVIPSEYQEKPVTAINDGAFTICDTVLKIVIPQSIKNIGRAFYRASMLSEFEVSPNNTQFVAQDGVLYNYNKSTLISYPPAKEGQTFDIPQSVTSLANSAFRYCQNLNEIHISQNLEDLGQRYFDSCFNLENIFVESANEFYASIDGVLFSKDQSILYRYPQNHNEKEYQIPQGVIRVEPYSFDESGVEAISIPQSVNYFTAVEYCNRLQAFSVHSDNENFSSIDGVLLDKEGQNLIQYPRARKGEIYNYDDDDNDYYYYEMPEGVDTINSWAFDSCRFLNKIVMPSSLRYISDIAFNNLEGGFELLEIVFEEGSQLQEIGNSAFMECEDIKLVVLTAITPPILGLEAFGYVGEDFSVYVPDDTFELYNDSDWGSIKNLERGQSLNKNVIKFHTNGGGAIADIDTVYLANEVEAEKEGFVFGGWYFDSELEKKAQFPLAVRENTDLYARWYEYIEGTQGLSFSLQNQTDTYAVIGYKGSENIVTIPTTHNNKLVTAIGVGAFQKKTHIREITLPQTILEIRNLAFAGDFNNIMRLEKINFSGSSLESIGNYAFSYCQNLETITLPDSLKSIGARAFNDCVSLKSITVPQNVTSIDDYVFSSCVQLENITVDPQNTDYISENGILYDKDKTALLQYPSAKAENRFDMPDTIEVIKSGAFSGATNLKEVTLSQNLKDIQTMAFHYSGLEQIQIPSSMTNLNPSVFRNTPLKSITIGEKVDTIIDFFHELNSLENIFTHENNTSFSSMDGVLYNFDKSVLLRLPTARAGQFTIPASVKEIAPRAFFSSVLDNITLNEGLEEIGEKAFSENNNIFEITLPASLDKIADTAFWNSYNLKAVFLTSLSGVPALAQNSFAGVDNNFVVYAPQDIISDLQNSDEWKNFDIVLADEVIDGYHIALIDDGYRILRVLKEDKNIVIPSQIGGVDIVEIAGFAFNSTIRKITLPQTIKRISAMAFANNRDLVTIEFEEGSALESIGQNAFIDCLSLTNIVLSSNPPEVISQSTITELIGRVNIIVEDSALYENTLFEELAIIEKSQVFDDFITTENQGQITITGYLGSDMEIIVPQELNGLSVVAVGEYFLNPAVERVILPSSVETIKDFAFSSRLYNSDIFEIPMRIEEFVFEDVKTIGKKAFEGLDITYVNIPESVTHIDITAFDDCQNLLAIDVDELNEAYSSVDGVLHNKTKDTLIKYPVAKPRIEYEVLEEVKIIGQSAFSQAQNLISIKFNQGLEEIGSLAFDGCTLLLNLVLPESLLKIQAFAFKNCYRLDTLTIPRYVQDIAHGIVIEGDSLRALYLDTQNEYYKSQDGVLFDSDMQRLISYPAGKKGAYTIPSSVKAIEPYAFYSSQLTNIIIPNHVEEIGEYAFGASHLETISIDSALEQLPQGMLKDCVYLETINLSESVKVIGDKFAMGAIALRNIEFFQGLEKIGKKAFYGCSRVNFATMPQNILKIGEEAFAYCTAMTRFVTPQNFYELGQGILRGNLALREITMSIDYNLMELFGEQFANAIPASLTEIKVHDVVNEIPEGFFKGYIYIEKVELSIALQLIGKEAFMDSASLEIVKIPPGYESWSIGERAFYNCYNLVYFEIRKSLPIQFEQSAFMGQSGGQEELLPDLTIYTPSNYYDEYIADEQWGELEIKSL